MCALMQNLFDLVLATHFAQDKLEIYGSVPKGRLIVRSSLTERPAKLYNSQVPEI